MELEHGELSFLNNDLLQIVFACLEDECAVHITTSMQNKNSRDLKFVCSLLSRSALHDQTYVNVELLVSYALVYDISILTDLLCQKRMSLKILQLHIDVDQLASCDNYFSIDELLRRNIITLSQERISKMLEGAVIMSRLAMVRVVFENKYNMWTVTKECIQTTFHVAWRVLNNQVIFYLWNIRAFDVGDLSLDIVQQVWKLDNLEMFVFLINVKFITQEHLVENNFELFEKMCVYGAHHIVKYILEQGIVPRDVFTHVEYLVTSLCHHSQIQMLEVLMQFEMLICQHTLDSLFLALCRTGKWHSLLFLWRNKFVTQQSLLQYIITAQHTCMCHEIRNYEYNILNINDFGFVFCVCHRNLCESLLGWHANSTLLNVAQFLVDVHVLQHKHFQNALQACYHEAASVHDSDILAFMEKNKLI